MSEFFRKSLYRPTAPKLVRVKSKNEITPGLVSVTLTGEDLATFPEYCPAAHVKLFLANEGEERPNLPQLGPDGPIWPKESKKPIVRTYSVRGFRPALKELDIEFAVHGVDGPASRFAKTAVPGDYVGISYPGGPDPMIPPALSYVLAGDMSALPAIASILEHLPEDAQGAVFVRADHVADIRELSAPDGVKVQWFVTQPDNLTCLIEEFKELEGLNDPTHFWIGGEHSLVVALRKYLTSERGVAKESMYALPYWRYRFSEESYHDQRDAVMNEEGK